MTEATAVLSRRRLLQVGAGASALLLLGGGAAWLWRPGWRDGRLTDSGRAVFRAIARVVLEGSLPEPQAAREAALDRHLRALDATVAAFPAATQAEVGQLLGLLSVAPARRWLTGLDSDWDQTDIGELEAMLRRLRRSDDHLRQQTYHALRDLTNAAFYAQPEHWALLGYPGPTEV